MLRRGASPTGGPILSTDPQPWQTEFDRKRGKHATQDNSVILSGARRAQSKDPDASRPAKASSHFSTTDPDSPIPAEELRDIATESSQTERRAADAERELIEWKKIKFMQDRVGDDFPAVVLSCTKYGFFVELDDLFIEGLVPIASLVGDFYSFRDTDRTIVGSRTGHVFSLGQKVHVLLDRIDRQQRRLQFALFPGTEPVANTGTGSLRSGKSEAKKAKSRDKIKAKKLTGKAKQRKRKKS
jgi:ribonuclease R